MKKKSTIDQIVLKMGCTEKVMPDPAFVVQDQDIIKQLGVINSLDEPDRDGRTLLMYAAIYERQAIIDYLIAARANLLLCDKLGFTVLHFAAQTGNRAIIEQLLRHGADVNAEDGYGNSPIMKCSNDAPIAVFELFVNFGANPLHKNKYGVSTLDVFSGQDDIIHVLTKSNCIAKGEK